MGSGLLVLLSLARAACTGTLTVLSAGAVEPALTTLLADHQRVSGCTVKVEFATGPELAAKLEAGAAADLLIAPRALVDRVAGTGQAIAETSTELAKVGVGITVRRGAEAPRITTVEALTSALLAADSIVYNRASTGLYLEGLFKRLAIADRLAPKTTRYADGAEVLGHVARGRGHEIGFGAITEIKALESQGLTFVGPLPEDVQNYTSYRAVVMAKTSARPQAEALLKFLQSPEARQRFITTGAQ